MARPNFYVIVISGGVLLVCFVAVWKYTFHVEKEFEEEQIQELKQVEVPGRGYEDFIVMRVAKSEENYQRALKGREALLQKHKINKENPWSFKNGVSIWDLFYPTFDCPHTVERIGRTGDGGKWICGIDHFVKNEKPCVVYSYGINKDTSFEAEILERTKCSVYMFDHTIDITKVKLPEQYPGRAFIEKVGLGITDTDKLRSLTSTMKKYDHKFVDILKMDVEGAEFKVFNAYSEEFANGLPFGQLQIEIHLPYKPKPDFLDVYIPWLQNLENMGLRPFRNEFNLISDHAVKIPSLCEFAYINVKVDNFLLHG